MKIEKESWKQVANVVSFIIAFGIASIVVKMCTKSKIEDAVSNLNKECPIKVDEFVTLEHVDYVVGREVAFTTIVEHPYNVDSLRSHPDIAKSNIMANYSNPNNSLRTFLKILVEVNLQLRTVYKDAITGKKAEVVLTVDDLKRCLDKDGMNVEEQLVNMVNSTNLLMPLQLTDGLVCMKMRIEEKTVFYEYEIDSDIMSFEDAKELLMSEDHRQSVKDNLKNSKDAEHLSYVTMATSGRGIGYRYLKKNSDEFFEYVIPNKELLNILEEKGQ